MRYFGGLRGIKVVGFSVALLATGLVLGASYGRGASSQNRHFEIVYPDLSRFEAKPCSAEDPLPCALEAAALAAALTSLDVAREVAEEAYQAWVDCVNANGGPSPDPNPNPNPPPRTVDLTSVLEATKK